MTRRCRRCGGCCSASSRAGRGEAQNAVEALRQAARETLLAQQRRDMVLAWSQAHSGVPSAQAACDLDLPPGVVRELLGPRLVMHPPRPATSGRRGGTRDEVLLCLQQFVAAGQRRRRDYVEQARVQGWPSSVVVAHLGSWDRALATAGYRWPSFTDDDLAGWVQAYVHAVSPPWTFSALDEFLRAYRDAPSAGMVRRRLGPWSSVLSDALNPLARPTMTGTRGRTVTGRTRRTSPTRPVSGCWCRPTGDGPRSGR